MKNKSKILVVLGILLALQLSYAIPVFALSNKVGTVEYEMKLTIQDYDYESGPGGTVYVYVTGYYISGQNYFYKVVHKVDVQLNGYYHIKDLTVNFYGNTYSDIGVDQEDISGSYTQTKTYQNVPYAGTATSYSIGDVYFLEFFIGWFDCEITIYRNPPE